MFKNVREPKPGEMMRFIFLLTACVVIFFVVAIYRDIVSILS